MKLISYGNILGGGAFRISLDALIDSRLLIQANSGGGKSYAGRKLLESTHGAVQQIILDPEGEYATLRETYDYVVASAQGGDALAHPKTAKLLAERLLETGVSAIVDIYELKHHERTAFVRIFLDAMVNAPKSLWHPCLVFLDEAHVYAPESDKSEAHGAVADMATRGRKRGFCLVAATQRISKLSKDVAAELNNKLIGRATLDVDVKRAAAELGIPVGEAMTKLRALEPGQFYGFGPATNVTGPALMKVGEVVTRHPKRGERATATPKPTQAILDVLPKLADLPKEAEHELRTAEDLRRELANVRRELTAARRSQAQPAAAPPGYSKEHLNQACDRAEREGFERGYKEGFEALANNARVALLKMVEANDTVVAGMESILAQIRKTPRAPAQNPAAADSNARRILNPTTPRRAPAAGNGTGDVSGSGSNRLLTRTQIAPPGILLPRGERATLGACIQYPDGLERSQLTVITGYKRSSRDAYIQRLREKGFVRTEGDTVLATEDGVAALPDFEPLPRGHDLIDFWNRKLPEGERKVLAFLIEANGEPVERAAIDAATGYQRSSRDAYLQRLRAKQLVIDEGRGQVKASPELFA